ncbi:acyl-CoA dehydrogenase family protein [Streptomyces roseicoloratus]|uniref:Acyl-CoA dehydrogenase family protein n=1 Tax=Streptomyces roseicoloratus TaxID=2508722 RepID=A0ABY9S0V0_9ACTN|nr:acyl-CoA dehydrogenase family protein [Streptomyces roseicoloratus]WMX47563.1 acyl-CoA dehydrogenase family protein [Streptomyces roseicoloratus]
MRFLPTDEQRAFTRSLDAMLTAADTPAVARAWAAGEPAAGRALWARLGAAGVFALAAPEAYGGAGPLPVELAHAFVESGRHAVPGPLVETVAATALLAELAALGEPAPAKRLLPGLVSGETVATLAMAEVSPYALDPDAAGPVLAVDGEELRLAPGHEEIRVSADPVRRPARPAPGGELLAAGPAVAAAARHARDWALLATAAQSLGVGLALLDRTVAYAKQRSQFGTVIGAFQAVKHRLADTLIGLEFARPLLFGAALTFESGDLAAAKAAAGEAAYAAAGTALQIHGAIGYTEELDLSLWLRKARPLRDAWGTPSWCRARVLAARGQGGV